uniref:Uncharacterized protein n=1 Tax=Astyanax mexicanus TaxID=7994 RepID=A0A8B9GLZ3_ASTMX
MYTRRRTCSPGHLLVCEKGNFKNEKSRHESQALKHSFNCRISLLIPECGRLPVMLEKVLSNFSSYFHVQDFPVSTFLEEKWLDAVKKGRSEEEFERVEELRISGSIQCLWCDGVLYSLFVYPSGGFYALSSKTRIDEDNVVAVLPSGKYHKCIHAVMCKKCVCVLSFHHFCNF